MLIEFDLLRNFGERWKYRYSPGAKYMFASSKERAIELATEAFRKARPGELLTRDERYEKAVQDDIDQSHSRWKHLSLDDLQALYIRMGGDTQRLRGASSREFTGNGGRRTSAAVAAQGARDTASMCGDLERYIQWRLNQ